MRADWSSFTQWHFSLPRFPLPALPRGWSAPLSSCHQYFLCLFLFASARKCALNPGTGGVHLLPHPYPCKYPVVCPIRWHGGGADGWEEVRRHLSGRQVSTIVIDLVEWSLGPNSSLLPRQALTSHPSPLSVCWLFQNPSCLQAFGHVPASVLNWWSIYTLRYKLLLLCRF